MDNDGGCGGYTHDYTTKVPPHFIILARIIDYTCGSSCFNQVTLTQVLHDNEDSDGPFPIGLSVPKADRAQCLTAVKTRLRDKLVHQWRDPLIKSIKETTGFK